MKLLLDTHVFIWWSSEPEKLSNKDATWKVKPGKSVERFDLKTAGKK